MKRYEKLNLVDGKDILQEVKNLWLMDELRILIKEPPEFLNPGNSTIEQKKTFVGKFKRLFNFKNIFLGYKNKREHGTKLKNIDLEEVHLMMDHLIDGLRTSSIIEIFRSEVESILSQGIKLDEANAVNLIAALAKQASVIDFRISYLILNNFEERIDDINKVIDELKENLDDNFNDVYLANLWLQKRDDLFSSLDSNKEQDELEKDLLILESIELVLLISSEPTDKNYLTPFSSIITKYLDLYNRVEEPFNILNFGDGFKQFVNEVGEKIDLKSLDGDMGGLYFPDIPAVGRYDHDKKEVIFFLKKSDK